MAVYRCVSCGRVVSDKSSACVYCGCSMEEIVAAFDREKENGQMNMKDFYIEGTTLIKYKGNDEHVVVPEGVRTIGRQAFTCRSTLLSVVLPEGVVTIGEQAFDSCHNLQRVEIPSTVTLIDKSAFASCRSLDHVVIPEGVPYISIKTFIGCVSLKSVSIPDSVTAIGEFAFSRCYSLGEIAVGDNVTDIGEDAFSYCKSLKAVYIGKGVEVVHWNTFAHCESLEKIAFSSSLREIVYGAFDQCPAIRDIYYEETEELWKSVNIARTKNTALWEATCHFEAKVAIPTSGNTETPVSEADAEAASATEDTLVKEDKAEATAKQITFDLPTPVEDATAEVADAPCEEKAEVVSEKPNAVMPEASDVVKTATQVTMELGLPEKAEEKTAEKGEETPKMPPKKKALRKTSPVRTTAKTAVSEVSEAFKNEFYQSYMALIPAAIAEEQKARAASMTNEEFETLSEALFLVPAAEAYEFGCMCLYMGKSNWAFRSFLSAAGKGHLPSQYYVGCCFLWGIDTTKKIVDAARWLTKCKNDSVYGEEAKKLIAVVDAELEKPENAGLKVKRGNK